MGSDWAYVAGEDGYNQRFLLQESDGKALDLTGQTLRIFIQSSDFATEFPASGAGSELLIDARLVLGRDW